MRDEPISDPPEEDLGSAMLSLDDRQRRFVVGWIGALGKNGARVARAAGYADTGGGAKVRAHKLLHSPKIIAALREEAERRLDGMAAIAVAALELNVGSSDPKVRQKAVDSILDRTGFARESKQELRIEKSEFAHLSTAELRRQIGQLLAKGAALPMIDTTAEEVLADDQ